jgi:hypothetical protein
MDPALESLTARALFRCLHRAIQRERTIYFHPAAPRMGRAFS